MRIRIKFSKTGPMQYVGHLDLFRAWERSFRRSGLPLAYSLGFHPQPRLNLACALPLGFTSEGEVLDAWLEETRPADQIEMAIEKALPPGLAVTGLSVVDNSEPALQTQVISAVYEITLFDQVPGLDERIQKLLASDHLPRVRRGKAYDLRPMIEHLALLSANADGHGRCQLQLSAREAATGRPEEVLDEMGIGYADTHVHRKGLIFS